MNMCVRPSPLSFSPKRLKNTVKLMGPFPSFSISSSSSSLTLSFPEGGTIIIIIIIIIAIVVIIIVIITIQPSSSSSYPAVRTSPSSPVFLLPHLCLGQCSQKPVEQKKNNSKTKSENTNVFLTASRVQHEIVYQMECLLRRCSRILYLKHCFLRQEADC